MQRTGYLIYSHGDSTDSKAKARTMMQNDSVDRPRECIQIKAAVPSLLITTHMSVAEGQPDTSNLHQIHVLGRRDTSAHETRKPTCRKCRIQHCFTGARNEE